MRSLEWRVEESCNAAWPALRAVRIGGWRLRLAPGISRRSNSLNPLGPDAGEVDATLAAAGPHFAANGLPVLFRVLTPLLDPSVDRRLATLGFTAEGETATLYAAIENVNCTASDVASEIERLPQPDAAWLDAMARIQRYDAKQAATFQRMMNAVAAPAAFMRLSREDALVALCYGAIHDRLLCCEMVITDSRHRGRGHAHRMLQALFGWARASGAEGVCLQVTAENAPALALYRGLGLTTELYRYHYRRSPDA